jgi:hypothetical protein
MPKMVVPDVDEIPGLVDPQHSHMKISHGATILWSSKFLKLARDAHGNHVIAL